MSSKTAVKLYTYVISALLIVSAVFLVKDIRNGSFFRDRLHFSQAAFFKDKKSCDVWKVDGCIPNPLTLWKARSSADAKETPEQQPLNTTSNTTTQTPPASNKPQPRFSDQQDQ